MTDDPSPGGGDCSSLLGHHCLWRNYQFAGKINKNYMKNIFDNSSYLCLP